MPINKKELLSRLRRLDDEILDLHHQIAVALCDVSELERATELRNEAERAGADELQPMYECGNCGVPRFVHGVILEACPNCGDDETDLSLIDEVP